VRIIFATDFRGHLRKVLWFTENKTGISAGICDSKANPHATYHLNGTYHHKVTTRGGEKLKIGTEHKKPLSSITSKEQLLGTATFYSNNIMARLPRYTPDGRADAMVILGQSVFHGIACASFASYILHRSHENAFIADAYSAYEDQLFTLVTVNVFALDLFPNLKVGVIVYRGGKLMGMPPKPD
jgi:hypothetical protein